MSVQSLTVRQIRERLADYSDECVVVVRSYEDGYDPVTELTVCNVVSTPNRAWWVGVYSDAGDDGQPVLLLASAYHQTEAGSESAPANSP